MCRNKNASNRRSKFAAGKRKAKRENFSRLLQEAAAAFYWPFKRRNVGRKNKHAKGIPAYTHNFILHICMIVCVYVCKRLSRQHAQSSVSHPWLNSWPRQWAWGAAFPTPPFSWFLCVCLCIYIYIYVYVCVLSVIPFWYLRHPLHLLCIFCSPLSP